VTEQDVIDLVNHAVEVAVQRAVNAVVVPRLLFGTVTELDASATDIHEVLMDGDDEEVAVMDVSGLAIAVGDRVAVVFAPAHQFWIIGRFVG
jgi:hypothetical protein